uniref:non-specific serine/threonine protein kinase n=1 Tax=Steinernema glaseri TaxID=37863 RepID=A0A1I7ZPW3_9BILA
MVQDQTVKLESWQEDEARQLSEKLTKELELLSAFQSRQKISLENQCERERVQLSDKIARRKTVLECRIEDEMKKLEDDRNRQLKVMRDRHAEELALLDEDAAILSESVSQMNLDLNSPSSMSSSCQFSTSSKRDSFSTVTNL